MGGDAMVDCPRRVWRAGRFVLASKLGGGRLDREQKKHTVGRADCEALARPRPGLPVIGLKVSRAASITGEDEYLEVDLVDAGDRESSKIGPHVRFKVGGSAKVGLL